MHGRVVYRDAKTKNYLKTQQMVELLHWKSLLVSQYYGYNLRLKVFSPPGSRVSRSGQTTNAHRDL